MTVPDIKLLQSFIYQDWKEVCLIPFDSAPFSAESLIIAVDNYLIRLEGKDHGLKAERGMPDGYFETYSLKIYDETTIPPYPDDWPRKDLKKEWQGTKFEALLSAPRDFVFYTMAIYDNIIYPSEGCLKHCAAIEFSKMVNGEKLSLVIAASQRDSLRLRVTTNPSEIEALKEEYDLISIAPEFVLSETICRSTEPE